MKPGAFSAYAVAALTLGLGLTGLAGCDREPNHPAPIETGAASGAGGQTGPVPASAPVLVASGPAQALAPDPEDDLQMAAAVVELDELSQQGDLTAKLFGTAGGDPAMNGLYTYIAFFDSVPEGWRIFRLGDFLDYRILSEVPGRVDLEIDESTLDADTGVIGQRTRRVIVTWTAGPDATAPAAVSVAPAD